MKIAIAAGGGGHFAPALAIIERLPKDTQVILLGRQRAFEADKTVSFEYRTAHNLGIPFFSITTGRLQRKLTRHTLPSLSKVPYGFYQAMRTLRKEKPDVVVSFGGYVTVPVILAATVIGIPIIVHEQTLEAGIANKIAARFAKKVCISYETSRRFFPHNKTILTGNPLRKNILESQTIRVTQEKHARPSIFITGGSLGSHAINIFIEQTLELLLERYTIYHQTGDAQEYKDYDRLLAKKISLGEKGEQYHLMKFVDATAMGEMLQRSDLVIARSGINTVTELLFLGVPSLLIPLPHGQNQEQRINALFLKKQGIAEVLEQKYITPGTLLQAIQTMIASIEKYRARGDAARHLVPHNASDKIIEVIIHEITKKKNL